VNRKYPIARLLAASRVFATATGERPTFEYVLLDGVNDGDADGWVVWDLDSYAYAGAEEAPDKVGLVSQPLSEVFQCLAR